MWYEKLDFEENPFLDTEKTILIGFEDIIEDVLYNIESGNIIFIEGKDGSGRTAILKKAINKFKGRNKIAYIDCSKIVDPNIEKTIVNYNLSGILFNKKPKNMIVLMDNINLLSEKNNERIKYFYDQGYIKSLVLTGDSYKKVNFSPSLKDRISKVITIKDLTENDAIDIVESRLQEHNIIPQDIIKDIWKKSKKNVKLFLQDCEKLCEYAVNNKEEKVKKEHIDKVLSSQYNKEKEKPAREKKVDKEKKGEPKKEEEEIKVIYEDIGEKYY